MATQPPAALRISSESRPHVRHLHGWTGFIILLAILEQVGVPNKILGYLFVFFTSRSTSSAS